MADNTEFASDWAASFNFSDDLKALEALYQEQHTQGLREQAGFQEEFQAEPITGDQKFLDSLSRSIANRLGDTLSTPEVLSQYLYLNDLERDNTTMARQIQALLKQLKLKDDALKALQTEANTTGYQPILGKLYWKS